MDNTVLLVKMSAMKSRESLKRVVVLGVL